MKSRHKLIAYHGNNRATFECASGHQWKGVVIPLKGRGARTVSESAVKIIVSWWGKGGCYADCRVCERETIGNLKSGG